MTELCTGGVYNSDNFCGRFAGALWTSKTVAVKALCGPSDSGRNIDTLFRSERRVERKPRALAVGIPTEVDR
jgi:hypothetical protein